ncbi:hypothetical protein ACFU5P_04690 [Streptomyces sp. NPDC057433]|uniref:hypothetical protein n=1 Tax=Streptomyces sp. NPDC057433 TaxID=3346132 RepID=UPI0036B9D8A0
MTSPVNGTVLVLFVWILDVFFGPVLGAADRAATSLRTASAGLCHRCRRSPIWTASGRARRTASA